MSRSLHDLARARFSGVSGVVRRLGRAIVLSTAVVALPLGVAGTLTSPAAAQQLPQTDPDAQLLLTADQLIYDNDAETVTALGDVKLDYDGYNVVAQRVIYNQRTRRVKAFGNVEIVQPDGSRIFAQEIDLTDDFSAGFVNSLRVERPDDTTFAAESAEREAGERTIFNQGVYTACKACPKNPKRPPLWQIKAEKVIVDGVEKTVTYRKARFEFFGKPIAYLPYFKHATPDEERKSGFIFGNAGFTDELGFWYRQPYFLVTGESHDLTVSATGFTRQGVLVEGRFRHQLENGYYELRAAGIDQRNRDAFSNPPDSEEELRGMIATRGKFDINPRWTFGWDVLAQSDNNFSRTYRLKNFTTKNVTNEIYLRGLNDRSYFDLSAKQYLIQTDLVTDAPTAFQDEDQQALVRPILDYNRVVTGERTGGELSLDVNLTSLERDEVDSVIPTIGGDVRTHGIDGETTRLSAEATWKKTYSTPNGLTLTPLLAVRGDWTQTNGFADPASEPVSNGSNFRFMPTAGLEASYPVLVRTDSSSHVFEPIAQLFVRPDLRFGGIIPNEDAQSLVFDSSSLFERDKFSGYDRIESGIRANVGIRYSGIFRNGWSLNAQAGQSYHIAGENPFATEDDLTNTGEESGLETDRSDFVGSFGLNSQNGFTLNAQARFNEDDFDFNRGQLALGFNGSKIDVSGTYTYIEAQPDSGFGDPREQIGIAGSYKIDENWSVFGGMDYNIQDNLVVRDTFGIAYFCDCFTLKVSVSEKRNLARETERRFGFNISLRTLGDFDTTISARDIESLQDEE